MYQLEERLKGMRYVRPGTDTTMGLCLKCETMDSTTATCANCDRISASMAFQQKLLEGLYQDATKGRGTDISVLCPVANGSDNSGDADISKAREFHVHHTIVAASSGYFRTFPEPRSGRVINDVDADTFSICLRFMYLGECEGLLAHENIAAILNASELLQIGELKRHCMEYLEHHLDHDNYEQVVDLAERFNHPQMKMNALRFKTKSSARDEIVNKRANLVQVIGEASFAEKLAASKKYELKNLLRKTDEQWKNICEEELQLAVSAAEVAPWDYFCKLVTSKHYKSDFKESSAVGRLVRPFDPNNEYVGSRMYGEESGDDESLNSLEESYEDDDSWYANRVNEKVEVNRPPPPTDEEHEKYGILYSHCSLKEAIQDASSGDRIFLAPGVHKVGQSAELFVTQAQDFIGMGRPDEVILEVNYGRKPFLNVISGTVGFFNITFRVNAYEENVREDRVHPWHHPGTGKPFSYHSIIDFEERAKPSEHENPMKNELTVKCCIFDLGTDAPRAFPTRVSGIFLKRGKSATIEGCQFLGGAGSAIAVVSDPYWYISSVEISQNTFIGNGQPTFSEKSVDHKDAFRNTREPPYSDKITMKPLPIDQIPPGPASVEFIKFNRKGYFIKALGYEEKPQTVSVKLEGNTFTSNLRAPLASRIVVPCSDDFHQFNRTIEKKNSWHLCGGITDEDNYLDMAKGFKLTVRGNVMKDNGLQFDQELLLRMEQSTLEAEAKKARIEEKEERSAKFPDGNSLLVINHFLFDFYQAFPSSWEYGDPFDNFEPDYLEQIPCKRRNSYDSWGW